MSVSIISWTCSPVRGGTDNPYRMRHGYRRTLWFFFVPLFTSTKWELPYDGHK